MWPQTPFFTFCPFGHRRSLPEAISPYSSYWRSPFPSRTNFSNTSTRVDLAKRNRPPPPPKQTCFLTNTKQGSRFKWHLLLNIRHDFTAFRGIPTPFSSPLFPSTPTGGVKSLDWSRCEVRASQGAAGRIVVGSAGAAWAAGSGTHTGPGAGRGQREGGARWVKRGRGRRSSKCFPLPQATLSFGVRIKYGNRIWWRAHCFLNCFSKDSGDLLRIFNKALVGSFVDLSKSTPSNWSWSWKRANVQRKWPPDQRNYIFFLVRWGNI